MMELPGCLFMKRARSQRSRIDNVGHNVCNDMFLYNLACNDLPVQSKQSIATKIWARISSPCLCRAKSGSAYTKSCVVGKLS